MYAMKNVMYYAVIRAHRDKEEATRSDSKMESMAIKLMFIRMTAEIPLLLGSK